MMSSETKSMIRDLSIVLGSVSAALLVEWWLSLTSQQAALGFSTLAMLVLTFVMIFGGLITTGVQSLYRKFTVKNTAAEVDPK